MIVAPNSPSARSHASGTPARMPGQASGRETRRNVTSGGLPSAYDTCSNDGSTASNATRDATTRYGAATKTCASTMPAGASVIVTPRAPSQAPSGVYGPKVSSNNTPPTSGGMTSGRQTSALTMGFPTNSARASTYASGTPRTT